MSAMRHIGPRQRTEQRQAISNAIAYINLSGEPASPVQIMGKLRGIGYEGTPSTVRTLLRKMVQDPSSGITQAFDFSGYFIGDGGVLKMSLIEGA
jgi:hypothetical protein